MTIKVTITNSDTRENAIIQAKNLYHTEGALPFNMVQLKPGESTDLYVYHAQDILITEIGGG